MPRLVNRPKKSHIVQIRFTSAEIEMIDLMAENESRATFFRHLMTSTFRKRFPIYSPRAQKMIEQSDAIAVSRGATPKKTITSQEFMEMVNGYPSPHHGVMIFPLRYQNAQGEWQYGGKMSVDANQDGFEQIKSRLLQEGLIEPDIDYIIKETSINPYPEKQA